MKKLFLVILFVVLFGCQFVGISHCFAANNAGAFLRNGVGARALGMGSAFIAICDSGAVSYWNPASLSFVQKPYLDTMYADKFKLGVEYGSVGVAMPVGLGGFGINYLQQGVKDIEKSTILDVNHRPIISGTFDNLEQAIFVSYGKTVNSKISFGVNFKYIYQKLDTHSASGLGADIGVLWKGNGTDEIITSDSEQRSIFLNGLSLGMVVQDVANSQIKWDTDHIDTIPMTLKLGAAYQLDINHLGCDNVILAVDMNKRENRDTKVNEGIEVNFLKLLALRAGLRDKDLSFGGSVSFASFKIDYAFITHSLGDTQYFSVGVSF